MHVILPVCHAYQVIHLSMSVLDTEVILEYNISYHNNKRWLTEMAKQTMLTEEGLKKYEQELEYLKTVKRKDVAEKIKVALSFGDLSENSEYDEAKNDQAMLEARISDIEAILKNAIVIDENDISNEHVHVGSKVKLYDFEFEEEVTYQIIGSTESDPFDGKLSDESPVGSALIDHKVGDEITVETPGGLLKFKILEISK